MKFYEFELDYRALANDVLAVAVIDAAHGEWTAYIGAVPGENHRLEAPAIAEHGVKLPQKLAEATFPHLKKYDWRK